MIQLIPFRLPLINSFQTAKGNFGHRDGVLIHFSINDSNFFAEISPLPGFSVSELDSCIQLLKTNAGTYDRFLSEIWNQHSDKSTFSSPIDLLKSSAEWRKSTILN